MDGVVVCSDLSMLATRQRFEVSKAEASIEGERFSVHGTCLQVGKQQRAAGLRLTHACMSVCGLQYPLTEEGFVSMLRHWAFDSSPQNRWVSMQVDTAEIFNNPSRVLWVPDQM